MTENEGVASVLGLLCSLMSQRRRKITVFTIFVLFLMVWSSTHLKCVYFFSMGLAIVKELGYFPYFCALGNAPDRPSYL